MRGAATSHAMPWGGGCGGPGAGMVKRQGMLKLRKVLGMH